MTICVKKTFHTQKNKHNNPTKFKKTLYAHNKNDMHKKSALEWVLIFMYRPEVILKRTPKHFIQTRAICLLWASGKPDTAC